MHLPTVVFNWRLLEIAQEIIGRRHLAVVLGEIPNEEWCRGRESNPHVLSDNGF